MKLQGYSNIYMLLLLLSAIAINAQAGPRGSKEHIGDSKEHPNGSKEHPNGSKEHPNGSKEHASKEKDNSNDTSISPGDNDNNDSNTSTGDDNISAEISNENGNGNVTEENIKQDIFLITNCILHTRIIGPLLTQVIRLNNFVFVIVPALRAPFINFYNYLFVFMIKSLVQCSLMLQAILASLSPFLELSVIFTF